VLSEGVSHALISIGLERSVAINIFKYFASSSCLLVPQSPSMSHSSLPRYDFHKGQSKRLSLLDVAGPLVFRAWQESCAAPLRQTIDGFVAPAFKPVHDDYLSAAVDREELRECVKSPEIVRHVLSSENNISRFLSVTPIFLWAVLQARKWTADEDHVHAHNYVSILRTDKLCQDRMHVAVDHLEPNTKAYDFAKFCQEILIFGYTSKSALVATFTLGEIEAAFSREAT
jgi:hypothetical protein